MQKSFSQVLKSKELASFGRSRDFRALTYPYIAAVRKQSICRTYIGLAAYKKQEYLAFRSVWLIIIIDTFDCRAHRTPDTMINGFLILNLVSSFFALVQAVNYNLTETVSWDKYSLSVNNKRVFIFAGEFHYQRLPVPGLWPDIFQKFRSQGLNAVSIYFFWSYHSPSEGLYDFETGAKNVQQLLDAAKKAGLWVIARPGPYCNAETNAGGFALWTTDGSGGKYRTSDEVYHEAWLPWAKAIGAILERNQITKGGPVILQQIENELQETVRRKDHTLVKFVRLVHMSKSPIYFLSCGGLPIARFITKE